ncbi:MAG: TRAP transporter small permease subunit [Gammaproteobacteria bacterium]|nr:TRAP transporter small permease subunit [Gammaproteobacteria bacterium]
MQALIQRLEQISEYTGRAVAWLTLLMVLITFVVVVLRYLFDTGSIALQESITYLHAFVFMLGAAYTLKHEGHVRVDIFYRNMTPQKQARVDFFGCLLLLIPVCLFITISSWDYVLTSWSLLEGSQEAGGLPLVYLLKTTMLVMTLLILIQGLAQLLRAWRNWRFPQETSHG